MTTSHSWTPDASLNKYAIYSSSAAGCAQSVSRPHIWASDPETAQAETVRVMGKAYGVGVNPVALASIPA
jgi:hypothetical protein